MDFGYVLTFVLACYGGANGIVYSQLLATPRAWISSKSNFLAKLVSCPLCVGFWLGVSFSLAGIGPMEYYTIAPWSIPMMFADGFAGSASAWILHLLLYDKMIGK
jgi:hypothetical protein